MTTRDEDRAQMAEYDAAIEADLIAEGFAPIGVSRLEDLLHRGWQTGAELEEAMALYAAEKARDSELTAIMPYLAGDEFARLCELQREVWYAAQESRYA